MNATFRFLLTGALAVGSAIAGVLGQLAGVHLALWVGGGLVSTAFLPVFRSPLRRRELPPRRPDPTGHAGRSDWSPAVSRGGGR